MAQSHFKTHVGIVNKRFPTAVRESLTNPEIAYTELFKGMVDTSGDLSTKLETSLDGGMGVYGKPNISNLIANTDFPTIQGEKSTSKTYHDGFLMVSKVTSQKGAYVLNNEGTRTKLERDVDALAISHAMEDNEIIMGVSGDNMMAQAGIYGLANHPDVGRVDSTLATDFANSSAVEVYNELKLQIHDFVKNVLPADSLVGMPSREITLVLPTEIYLILALAEVTKGTELVPVIEALKKDCAAIGGLRVINNATSGLIKHLDPANDSKCAILGYFDKHYVSARIPAPVDFLSGRSSGGDEGDSNHVNKVTSFESLFVSKSLGLQLRHLNISGSNQTKKVLRILQGC